MLIECLDEDYIRGHAITDLEHIGVANDDVFRALVRCLYNEDGGTCVYAARTLAALFGKDAIEAIRQYQQKQDREVKEIAKIMEDLKNGREVRSIIPRAETKKTGDGK